MAEVLRAHMCITESPYEKQVIIINKAVPLVVLVNSLLKNAVWY